MRHAILNAEAEALYRSLRGLHNATPQVVANVIIQWWSETENRPKKKGWYSWQRGPVSEGEIKWTQLTPYQAALTARQWCNWSPAGDWASDKQFQELNRLLHAHKGLTVRGPDGRYYASEANVRKLYPRCAQQLFGPVA